MQAKGGAGLITVLETAIDRDRAITQPTQLNLGSDFYIPALTSVAEVIKAGGAIASIQLNHGGPAGGELAQRRQESHRALGTWWASSPRTGGGASRSSRR